jgi:hypothetical protein
VVVMLISRATLRNRLRLNKDKLYAFGGAYIGEHIHGENIRLMNRILLCLLIAALLSVVGCGAKEENNASQTASNSNAKTEGSPPNSQGKSLDEEMARLKVSTALVLPSERIVHLPVWSPESDQVASMIGKRWYSVNLRKVVLTEFDWKNQKAGQVSARESVELASTIEMRKWQEALASVQENQKIVTTKNGVKLELRKEGTSTSFIATKIAQNPRVIWSVEENCEALTLSPDEKYVAFVGETSGVFVVNLSNL